MITLEELLAEEMKDPDAECHDVAPKTPAQVAKSYQQERREQVEKAKISAAEIKRIEEQCEKNGINPAVVCEKCGVAELKDLTKKQYVWVCENWSKEVAGGV